jgi:hypothetical protein
MKSKLFTNIKVLSTSVLLAMTVAGTASAASVSFGSSVNLNGVAQIAADGSGLTSVNVPANNLTDGSNGFFVETFDKATQTLQPQFLADGTTPNPNSGTPFPDGDTQYNNTGFDDCAVNGTGAQIGITQSSSQAFGVRQGTSSGVAAAPLNDSTCFGYTPRQDGSGSPTIPSWVEVDYSTFLSNAGDFGITYLGFYWGSIDTYNDFTFYNAGGAEIQTITGRSLLNQANGSSGSQTGAESNLYVAIDFSFAEAFTKLRISTNSVAGEFDNVTIGLSGRPITPVPAPSGLALLGLGLLGLGLKKRLSK